MGRVALNEKQLLIDGKPVYLRSGEIQYFRIKRDQWRDRINALKAAGHNCVASYIVWGWHEIEEGLFDFTGETLPERDVIHFLNLVKDAGLYFFARVGPFVNAELVRGGYPHWLFERYPELQSKDATGRYAHRPNDGDLVPSQLNSRYLHFVENWYEHVARILLPYSIDNGGPLILLQPDNEPNLVFTYGVDGSLYDEHVIGDEGLWPKWVKEQYGSGWAQRYAGLTDGVHVPVPRTGESSTTAEYRLVADWLRFKRWHVFEYLRRLSVKLQELGFDLPFTINEPINRFWTWASGEHGEFSEFMNRCGQPFFTNGHCYLNYGGEQNVNGAPVTIARIESVKMSSLSGPPSIYELGSWYLLPQAELGSYNWDLMTKLLIGSGMNGYSVYIYAGGQSARGWGKIGQDYDWVTAIRADGTRAKPYYVLRDINRFISAWEPHILASRKRFDITIGLWPDLAATASHVRLPQNFGTPGDARQITADVFTTLTDLFRVLTNLSLNFELMSFGSPNREPGAATSCLVVPNNGALSRQAATFIKKHLQAGGHVIFYPFVPVLDEAGQPMPELATLSGQEIIRVEQRGGHSAGDLRGKMIDGRKTCEVGFDTPVVHFAPPDDATVLATHAGKPAAYQRAVGNGAVTVMGFVPRYWSVSTQALFEEIFADSTGIKRVASSDDGSTLVLLRQEPGGPALVTVASVAGEEVSTRIHIETETGRISFPMIEKLELAPKEARFLWVRLPLPEAKLLYATSQILPGDAPSEYLLCGAPGTAGELAFDRPLRMVTDTSTIEPIRSNDHWVITYRHTREPLHIRLVR